MTSFHFSSSSSPHPEGKVVDVSANLESKAELFKFLSQAIPLPNYFGHNWDALEECLGEIGALVSSKITLIHQDIPLKNGSADQRIYLEILAGIARNPGRLSVVFPESCRAKILRVLSPTTD